MRKLMVMVAAIAATVGSSAALAQFPFSGGEIKVELNPSDPKYNTPECAQLRERARTYKGATISESAGSFIVGLGVPGGGIATAAAEMRKRELIMANVEKTCMTNPPDRRYLDPGATIGR